MSESAAASPRSPLVVVFLTVFVDLVGFGIVIPILPLYAERFHPSPLLFGLFMASYSFCQFLFAPILGRWSDRIGRRPVLLLSLAGSVAGYLLFAFAGSLPLLFLSRIVAGACGANVATAQAVVADVTPPERRARGMGIVGAAFGLCFVFGPAIGGWLVAHHETWPGLFAASFSAAALLLAAFFLPETRRTGEVIAGREGRFAALGEALRRPALAPFLAAFFLSIFAFSSFESTFSLYVHGAFALSPREIAWWFCYVGVAIAIVQGGAIGAISRVAPEWAIAIGGLVLTAAGLSAMGWLSGARGLYGVLAVLALGTGLTNPTLSALVSKRSGAHEQGAILGAWQSAGSLGRIGGPIAGQLLYGARAPLPFFVGSAIVGIAAALLWFRRADLFAPRAA